MKYPLITALIIAGLMSTTKAQVASHASTASAKATAFQSTTLQPSGKPVAKVNGTVLTDKDLLREMYAIFPYAKQHNGGFPKAQEPEIRQGALEMIIFEEMVYQEALRRKMTIAAAKIDKGAAAYRAQFDSPEQFQQYMQSEMNGSQQKFRTMIERSMLIDQLLRQEVDNKSIVSLAEIKAYYDKHGDRFQLPESYTFQSISIIPPLKPTAEQAKEAKKKADEALKQAKAIKSYQDFGLLAEKISEDDYRVNMGDHKVVPANKLPPQVIAVLKAMKPGDVSGLIQIDSAYTIVRLNAHTLAHKQNFDEVKGNLRNELQQQKTEELRVNLAKQLRAKSKIEVV